MFAVFLIFILSFFFQGSDALSALTSQVSCIDFEVEKPWVILDGYLDNSNCSDWYKKFFTFRFNVCAGLGARGDIVTALKELRAMDLRDHQYHQRTFIEVNKISTMFLEIVKNSLNLYTLSSDQKQWGNYLSTIGEIGDGLVRGLKLYLGLLQYLYENESQFVSSCFHEDVVCYRNRVLERFDCLYADVIFLENYIVNKDQQVAIDDNVLQKIKIIKQDYALIKLLTSEINALEQKYYPTEGLMPKHKN